MKKIKVSDLWERVANGEPVYLNDVCDTDAAYMIMGEFTMVKYPGETPFRILTSETSAQNAISCGQEITEDEFNKF
jgi:hypothetical protein